MTRSFSEFADNEDSCMLIEIGSLTLMGVTLGGLLILAVLGKIANFVGSLWPF